MAIRIISNEAREFLEKKRLEIQSTDQPNFDAFFTKIFSLPLIWKQVPSGETDDDLVLINVTQESMRKGLFGREDARTVIIHCNAIFQATGICSNEEAKLLVRDKVRRLRARIDYLSAPHGRRTFSPNDRPPIPESVRHEVWPRDQGQCIRCGSVQNLEFDHVIPVSKGGSGTARNIQLLCEPCNRAKSDNI
jgi:hypothetical protein